MTLLLAAELGLTVMRNDIGEFRGVLGRKKTVELKTPKRRK